MFFFFSSRRRHTRSVSAFLLNRSSDLLQAGTSAVSDKLLDLVGLGGKSAADKGKDTRDYLAAAFPELNAWERAGADASSAGMVDAGFENQKELTKMQLDNQKEIRSEERFSRNAETDLVCRLLLEKKNHPKQIKYLDLASKLVERYMH